MVSHMDHAPGATQAAARLLGGDRPWWWSTPHPRTRRDTLVDLLALVFALGIGAVALNSITDRGPVLLGAGIAVGIVMCAALWWRRRFPVALALVDVVTSTLSPFAQGAGVVLLLNLAVHAPTKRTLQVVALHLLALPLTLWLHPDPEVSLLGALAFSLVMIAGVVAWGMFIRARRELVASLRERAERAEAERELEAQRAQLAERERIAREMHDVLAHRLSLLSLHAGVLEFRPEAPPDDVRRAAGVIRANAHDALQELRAVIGALREDDRGRVPEPPQPTLVDLPRLVEESRQAGARVDLDCAMAAPAAVPDSIGRHAYRVVQEGLTNARKHAPGCAVVVRVAGGPDEGLRIEVRNPLPADTPSRRIPGAGAGLSGLRERVAMVGGELRHGPADGGEHHLSAWMPWPA